MGTGQGIAKLKGAYGGWVGRWWVGARLEAKSGGGCKLFGFYQFLILSLFLSYDNFFQFYFTKGAGLNNFYL